MRGLSPRDAGFVRHDLNDGKGRTIGLTFDYGRQGRPIERNRPRVRYPMNDFTNIVGFIAAIFTTFAFVPQVIKVWRTRSTADISLGMYSLFTLGVALWLAYGILLDAWPIILANIVTLLLAGAVLVMKVKFG